MLKVDREAGIIYGVKILGWSSVNHTNGKPRRYLPEAGKKALPMYEGAKCYSNHPPKNNPAQTRENEDALGIWHNPRWEPDGVYADLHYLKAHPVAENVCEDAERGLGIFGASHNADGTGDVHDGAFAVSSITEVRSVDMVTDPATVRNLWESRIAKQKIYAVLSEQVLPALVAGRKKRLEKFLLENKAKLEAAEMQPSDGGGDHKDHLYSAMRACEEAGDSDMATKIHGLMKPAKPDEDMEDAELQSGDGGPGGGVGDGADKSKTADVDEGSDELRGKNQKGQIRAIWGKDPHGDYHPKNQEAREIAEKLKKGETRLTEARARDLCELGGIDPKPTILNAVIGLTEAKAVEILKLVKQQGVIASKTSPPRSQYQGQRFTEGKEPKDAKEFATTLLN